MRITRREYKKKLRKYEIQFQNNFLTKKQFDKKVKALNSFEVVSENRTAFDFDSAKLVIEGRGNATKKIAFIDSKGKKATKSKLRKITGLTDKRLRLLESTFRGRKVTSEDISDFLKLVKNKRELQGWFDLQKFNDFFRGKEKGFRLNGQKIDKANLLSELVDYDSGIGQTYISRFFFTQKGNIVNIDIDKSLTDSDIPASGLFTDKYNNEFVLSTN